jgi:hypothetical protein
VLQHLTDAERVFAYRALRIAANDETRWLHLMKMLMLKMVSQQKDRFLP